MHSSTKHVLQFFKYEHLPVHMQEVSKPFCELACTMADKLPDNPETTVAVRKLLEAKDAAVRALICVCSLLIFCLPLSASNDLLGPEPPPIQLVSDEAQAAYEKCWPDTKDPSLLELKNRGVVFYDANVMPPAYQDWDGALQGVHSVHYNISAVQPQEPYGNANREFPWGTPAGLHGSSNFKAVRFFTLPKGRKVSLWRQRLARDTGMTYVWEFPEGTTFGEMLMLSDPSGYDHTFEVRVRTKERKGRWRINVFRPFRNASEYANAVNRMTVLDAKPGTSKRLNIQNAHNLLVFDSTATLESLPAMPELAVTTMLKRPFVSVLGSEWKEEAHAPTTDADFHIVPKGYKGAFVEVSSKSCMNCHSTTLMHARDFDADRDWYGRVRGSDNIFTFHPFDRSSISGNGTPLPVRLNPKLSSILEVSATTEPDVSPGKQEGFIVEKSDGGQLTLRRKSSYSAMPTMQYRSTPMIRGSSRSSGC